MNLKHNAYYYSIMIGEERWLHSGELNAPRRVATVFRDNEMKQYRNVTESSIRRLARLQEAIDKQRRGVNLFMAELPY